MAGDARVGTIYIGMRAGVGGLAKDLKSAGAEVGAFASFTTSRLGAIGIGLGSMGLGATVGFLHDAVTAGGELNDVVSASAAVFGRSSKIILDEADKQASAYGVVKKEFVDAASSFGAMFKGVGKSTDEAAELGVQLAKLGGDLASFKGTSNEDAFGAISAALRGEFDPIERYNVFLSAAKIENQALATGLAKSKGEITDQAKKMATLAAILGQTTDAQGDLARTADQLTNQFKKAGGSVENFKADVGLAAIDVSTFISGGLNVALSKAIGLWDENSGSVQDWASAAVEENGIVFKAIGYVGEAVAVVAESWQYMGAAFSAAASGVMSGLADMVEAISEVGFMIDKIVRTFGGDTGIVGLGDQLRALTADMKRDSQDLSAYAAEGFAAPSNGDAVRAFFKDIQVGALQAAEASKAARAAVADVTAGPAAPEAAKAKGKEGPTSAGAFELGSNEARSALIQFGQDRRDKIDEVARNTRATNDAIATANAALSSINRILGSNFGSGAQPVL